MAPEFFAKRSRRCAPVSDVGGEVLAGQQACLSAQLYPRTDSGAVTNPGLSAKNSVILDDHPAGKPYLGGHDHMPADLAVVPDMNQVVELGAISDPGVVQRPAIHARIGADLDIVSNLHPSDLRELLVVIGFHDKSESVGTDYGTRIQDDPVSQANVAINLSSRFESALDAESRITCDESLSADDGARSDDGPGFDHREWPDLNLITEVSCGIHTSRRVDGSNDFPRTRQRSHRTSEGPARLGNSDDRAVSGLRPIIRDHAAGLGGRHVALAWPPIPERQLFRGSALQSVTGNDFQGRIADQFPLHQPCYFRGCHGLHNAGGFSRLGNSDATPVAHTILQR